MQNNEKTVATKTEEQTKRSLSDQDLDAIFNPRTDERREATAVGRDYGWYDMG